MKDIEKIIEALPEAEREETKEFLNGLNPITGIDTKEKASDFIDKNEYFLKAKDSFISKATDAYHGNHFKNEVDKTVKEKIEEYIKEKNPKETADQKLIRELTEKDKARDAKDLMRDQKEILLKKALDDKLPSDLNLDLMIGEDDKQTEKNYDSLVTPFLEATKILQADLEKAKANTGMPKKGSPDLSDVKNPYMETPRNLSMIAKLMKEDPKLLEKFKAEHQATKQ